MTSNWTPGPWVVFSDREDELKVRSAQDDFIADCADGFWSDEADGWVMAAESEANARLVAEAPAMAEAIRRILECVDPEGEGTFDNASGVAANRPSNGELVLKGSFIERCSALSTILARAEGAE